MSVRIPSFVQSLFRIPGEPTPPPGDPSELRVFRAGPGYLRYKLGAWAIAQTATLGLALGFGLFAGASVGFDWGGAFPWGYWVFGAPAYLLFFGQLFLSFFALRLDFEMRWYMLGGDALRIREGVLSVKERTMSYANIQQVSVKRGPLQSLLGIGDIEVRSAGGGSVRQGKPDEHRGFLRGVADPERISDLIRSKVESHRGTGLGDDEAPYYRIRPQFAAEIGPATLLAKALVGEIRGLRHDLQARD